MTEVWAFFAGLLIVGVTAFLAGMSLGYTNGSRDAESEALETQTEAYLELDS